LNSNEPGSFAELTMKFGTMTGLNYEIDLEEENV
jgi:hypothetical protein